MVDYVCVGNVVGEGRRDYWIVAVGFGHISHER